MKPTVLQSAGRQEFFVTTPYNFTAAHKMFPIKIILKKFCSIPVKA